MELKKRRMRVIFVHLGGASAKHLWANIRHLNQNFPEIPVAVIINDDRHGKYLEIPYAISQSRHNNNSIFCGFDGTIF